MLSIPTIGGPGVLVVNVTRELPLPATMYSFGPV